MTWITLALLPLFRGKNSISGAFLAVGVAFLPLSAHPATTSTCYTQSRF